jgi:uncharacterized protein YidB (DUF937 family)
MARGYPSMTALLALLAIAGYQNRDKIAEMFGKLGQNKPQGGAQSGTGGFLEQLGLGGASAGGILSGGLGELIDRFKQSGQAETAESWVRTGPNKPCKEEDLERAIGPDVFQTLTQQTGLSREEVLLDDYEAEDVVQETFIKKLLERAIDGLCCRQSPQNEACRQEASARSARKRWRALLCVVREGAAELALS